jgi:four helix bundle protein
MENKVYDLKKRAYIYTLDVIKFLEGLSKDYITQTIGRQLLRSATSIGANIVEAQAASSKKDFANFYGYSLKSANETKFWLSLLKDSGKANNEKANPVLQETNELSNILASSILTIRGKKRLQL